MRSDESVPEVDGDLEKSACSALPHMYCKKKEEKVRHSICLSVCGLPMKLMIYYNSVALLRLQTWPLSFVKRNVAVS
jgi:hypothetical protein